MCDEFLVEVCIWPDGTWCEYGEQYSYTHMSDDYVLEKLSEQEYNDLIDGDLVL